MSKAYTEAWIRSVEGFSPPKAGEVAVFYLHQDYTDFLRADFDVETIEDEWIDSFRSDGGEMAYPEIHYYQQ